MRVKFLVLIFSLTAVIRASGPAKTKILVQGIERRLAELDGRFQVENGKILTDDLARIAVLSSYAADSREFVEAKALLDKTLEENHKATRPLILEMSILALRLQRYKEIGDLTPGVPNVKELKKFIDNPWAKTTPTPVLEQDILALIQQLKRYDDYVNPSGSKQAESPRRENLAEVSAFRRKEIAAAVSQFELDAGRGKPETDPIPDLMRQLASGEPRERALAADELGKRGAGAAAAIAALRAALVDLDPRVRASAVLALSGIGGLTPEIVKEIRRALGDKNQDVRLSARAALERLERGALPSQH